MSADALFQLGIVSVALNTSQTEEHSHRPARCSVVPARAAFFSAAVVSEPFWARPRLTVSEPFSRRVA